MNSTDQLDEYERHVQRNRLSRWINLVFITLRALFSRKLQLALVLLTMSIGAFSLATTLFAGKGAMANLWQNLDALMGNRVEIESDPGPNGSILTRRAIIGLTEGDFQAVKEGLPDARYVVKLFHSYTDVASFQNKMRICIDGIGPEVSTEPLFFPTQGRSLSRRAHMDLVYECMLTESAIKRLQIRAIPTSISIGYDDFLVVGILPDPPETSDRFLARAVMPYATAQRIWGRDDDGIGSICVSWAKREDMEKTLQTIGDILDRRRGKQTFFLSCPQSRIQRGKSIVRSFMTFGIIQAGFCITIASIGIFNVMLANVVTRSREYAIRISMGASRADTAIMVCIESLLVGVIGGAIGVGSAVAVVGSLCNLAHGYINNTALVPQWNVEGFLIPILMCAATGLAAGIIPAVRSTRLDILEILRAE